MTRGSAGSEYRRRCCDRTRVGRAGCKGVRLKRTCAFALGFWNGFVLQRQTRGQTRLAPVMRANLSKNLKNHRRQSTFYPNWQCHVAAVTKSRDRNFSFLGRDRSRSQLTKFAVLDMGSGICPGWGPFFPTPGKSEFRDRSTWRTDRGTPTFRPPGKKGPQPGQSPEPMSRTANFVNCDLERSHPNKEMLQSRDCVTAVTGAGQKWLPRGQKRKNRRRQPLTPSF